MMDEWENGTLDREEDTLQGKFVTFRLGNENYGIEIRHVTEIIGMQPITEVPELPGYIRGIINLRGKIIPVIDVRLRFKKPFLEYHDRTCVIVIDVKGISVGLIVDSVSEVLTIAQADIVAPPELNKGGSKYITGIGKVGSEVKLLLDCDALLNEREMDDLSNLA